MNNTMPNHIQLVQKPVYSVLGLISNLASNAGKVNVDMKSNLSHVISTNRQSDRFYACVIIWSHVTLKTVVNNSKNVNIVVKNVPQNCSKNELFYFVEGIDNKRTNPAAIFRRFKSPPYPDNNVFAHMRNAHNPMVLSPPKKVVDGKIFMSFQLRPPFVMAIRICSKNIEKPKEVKNLRIRKVNSEEILIFWSDAFYRERYFDLNILM